MFNSNCLIDEMLKNDGIGCAVCGCSGQPAVFLNFEEADGAFYFCDEHFDTAFLIQDTKNEKAELEKFIGRNL